MMMVMMDLDENLFPSTASLVLLSISINITRWMQDIVGRAWASCIMVSKLGWDIEQS